MISLLILSILISAIVGSTMLGFLFEKDKRDIASSCFNVLFGIGIGTGITSVLYYLYKMFIAESGAGYRIFEPSLALLLILGCIAIRKKCATVVHTADNGSDGSKVARRWALPLVLSVLLVGSVVSYVFLSVARPHGAWDAWGIWNLRARFLFRGKAGWTVAFSDALDWFKPDYPNLLPGAVARTWEYMGADSVLGPIVIALLFTLASVGLLVSSVSILRGRQQGILSGIALLGTTIFTDLGASQYADVPLSFFILAALVCLAMAGRNDVGRSRWVSLAGLSAGLAAWTKNEGVMFLAVLVFSRTVVLALPRNRERLFEDTVRFIAGLAPILLVVAHFKLFHAPKTWLTQSYGAFEKMLDPSRYVAILAQYLKQNWAYPLPLYAGYLALVGVETDPRDRDQLYSSASSILMMVLAFSGVYLITPLSLDEHLRNSVERVFVQLWPAFLFLFFMSARSPRLEPSLKLARHARSGARGN